MASDEPTRVDERADRIIESRGRKYTYAGAATAVALGAVLAAGIAGAAGIGIALTLAEATLFVLGASVIVLSLGLLGTLFSMRKTLNTVREQQANVEALQASRARSVAQEQRRTDRTQDQEIADLRASTASGQEGLPDATPFGNIHHVRRVEGIDEAKVHRLKALNIVDTEQLWKAQPGPLADELDVPTTTVKRWQNMAELMALEPVEPPHAELLVSAGITSIDELALMEPETVAQRIQEANIDRKVHIQGHPVSTKHTDPWVYAAQKHDPSTTRTR